MSIEPTSDIETRPNPAPTDAERKWQRGLVAASSILFVLSLACPAIRVRGEADFGILYFMVGWLGPAGAEFGWFANPLIWIGNKRILEGDYREGAAFAGLALALILFLLFRGTILVNEGGGRSQIEAFEFGYWAWALSSLISLVGGLSLLRKFGDRRT